MQSSTVVVVAVLFLAGTAHGLIHKFPQKPSSSGSGVSVQVIQVPAPKDKYPASVEDVPATEDTEDEVSSDEYPGVIIQPIFLHKPSSFVRPHPNKGKSCRRPNEVWYKCRSQCALTCANLPKACASTQAFGCESGCDCAYGFARLTEGGLCVPRSKCRDLDEDDRECRDPNEVYTECGNQCSEDCALRQHVCAQLCKEGCFCRKDYVRINGVCVPERFCPSTTPNTCTGQNEDPTPRRGYQCEERCGYDKGCRVGKWATKCFCAEGFKRINGKCVAKEQCEATGTPAPPMNCTGGSVYNPMGKPCLSACGGSADCAAQPSCVCPSGQKFVDGVCREESQCCSLYPNTEWKLSNDCLNKCWPGQNIVCGEKKSYGCFCKANYCSNVGYCVANDEVVQV